MSRGREGATIEGRTAFECILGPLETGDTGCWLGVETNGPKRLGIQTVNLGRSVSWIILKGYFGKPGHLFLCPPCQVFKSRTSDFKHLKILPNF